MCNLKKKKFAVTRADGLCRRLLALMNAIVLSELHDKTFGFIWPQRADRWKRFHSVEDAWETFSDDFANP